VIDSINVFLPDLPIPDVPTVYERQSYIMSPFGYLKILSWVFLTMGWSFLVEEGWKYKDRIRMDHHAYILDRLQVSPRQGSTDKNRISRNKKG